MAAMDIFRCDDLDAVLVNELLEDVNDHYVLSESALVRLDTRPEDQELINSLFRSVHTIKGDLGIVGFSPGMPLLIAVEDLLGMLRSGEMEHSPIISDLILLVLDRVRAYLDSFRERGYVEYDHGQVQELGAMLTAVMEASKDTRIELIAAVIRQLDPDVVIEPGVEQQADQVTAPFLTDFGLEDDQDVVFFRSLITPVEQRSHFWLGRNDRILKMSLILNQLAGNRVDKKQLAIAVYAHDFGMAFLPFELLHKEEALSNNEILLLRSHVQAGIQLLQNNDKWQGAKEIVAQHHEAANGSGYPNGLREKEICDGAKILAIADTFDAMTHQRAYSSEQKRPIIRAVKEINDHSGKQLCQEWVDIFNQAVQPVLLAHRARQL